MSMNSAVLSLLVALAVLPCAIHAAPPALLFLDDFEDMAFTRATWGPAGAYSFAQGRSGGGIRVVQSAPGGSLLINASVDLAGAGGCTVAFSAHMRTEKVEADDDPRTGAALYLRIHSRGGPNEVHALPAAEGSRDWWNAGILIAVPAEAESADLYAGLEGSAGRVIIDNVRLEIVRTPADFPPPRDPAIPIDKAHDLGVLRGATVAASATAADLEVLGGAWNANVIRWPLGSTLYPEGLLTPGFDAVLEAELARLDAALPRCAAQGLLVLVDLHSLSWGCFESTAAQDRFVSAWETIARRYRQEPMIWGYDLANEPDGTLGAWGDGVLPWEPLAERTARAIRAVDARRPVVVEPLSGSPGGFPSLLPLDFSIPGIVYSVHMYEPHSFTHQLLNGSGTPFAYPGHVEGEFWDAIRLRAALQPVREFQEKYRVPILVGEFGAVRWALQGSAHRYLRDAIEVFEAWDWDWCYHAFREWHGWSIELTEDPKNQKPPAEPTDRELLVRGWFAGNAKYFPGHERPVERP